MLEAWANVSIPVSERAIFKGEVRQLRVADIASIRPIIQTWTRDLMTQEVVISEVEGNLQSMERSCYGENDRVYFVAVENGEICGVMGLGKPRDGLSKFVQSSNPVELVNAYVASEHRKGRGVGRALVARVEEEAMRRGYTEIMVNSGERFKDTGWGFYDRLDGYQPLGIAEHLYGPGKHGKVWSKKFQQS